MGDVAIWYVGGCLTMFCVGWATGIIHKSIIQLAEGL